MSCPIFAQLTGLPHSPPWLPSSRRPGRAWSWRHSKKPQFIESRRRAGGRIRQAVAGVRLCECQPRACLDVCVTVRAVGQVPFCRASEGRGSRIAAVLAFSGSIDHTGRSPPERRSSCQTCSFDSVPRSDGAPRATMRCPAQDSAGHGFNLSSGPRTRGWPALSHDTLPPSARPC